MSDHSTIAPPAPTVAPAASKETMPAQELLQNDPVLLLRQNSPIQFKLSVDAPDDPLEHEADAMADTVMRMPEQHFIQRACSECDEEEKLQRKPLVSFIQRKESSPDAEVSDSLSNQIDASKGSGSSMDTHTQSFMQSRFGADFSDVKIHTGGESVQMNRDLNAKAFTVGKDIYFNQGQYDPGSSDGKHLLAHELTHTVQQSGVQISRAVIQRKVLPDEEKKHEAEGLSYPKVIKANMDGWDNVYKFYNIFLKIEIFPGSQPVAYANHVYDIQKFFIKTYPKEWTGHIADGILDEKTLSYLMAWADLYAKESEKTEQFEGLDTEVLKRLIAIKPTKNPPLMSDYLKDVYQFQLVNDYGFAIESGSKGEYVNTLQKALVYLHYSISDKEMGIKFGPETKMALEHFQRDAGVEEKKVDGRFGQHSLRLLDDLLAGKGSVLVLPGMYSYVEANLHALPELRIDGDGDQRKELLLKFSVKGTAIQLTVTHIDTKESAGPFSFTADGIDLSKEVRIAQQRATEGLRASEISITNTNTKADAQTTPAKKIIEVSPPENIHVSGKYILKSGSQSYNTSFDTSKMVFEKVISSDIVVEPNTVAAEVKLGFFKDKFRFTIVKDKDTEDKESDEDGKGGAYHYLLKIAGVGGNGDMVFAKDVPFVLEKEGRIYQLVFNPLQQDEISVLYDFDGDTVGDIKVNTILSQVWDDRQDNKKIPETGRRITVVLTGPALTERTERNFSLVNGKFQFEEVKTKAVFEGAIAAEGGSLLKGQQVPENINKEIEGIDAALEQMYQQAVSEGIARKETYLAYRFFKEGFKILRPITAKTEDQLTEEDKKQINTVASYADVFYELFKEDTKDARKETESAATEASSSDTETNPFTGESVTTYYVAFTSPTQTRYERHPGDEIRAHQWSKAGATLAALKKGYNLWVSEKVKEKYGDKENNSLKIAGFYQYLTGLEEVAQNPHNKYITRVKAIYYSWDQFTKEPGVKPIELPVYYYLDEDAGEWWVADFVRPDQVFRRKVDVDSTNKHIVKNNGSTPAPPASLFEKLDSKEHLPKGVLLYDAGQGIEGRIEMTEPWEWKDILGWIGLGLAAIGLAALVVLSDGTATPLAAEVFFALSAVAGGTAAALDLWSMHKDEGWNVRKALLDIGQIAASLLTLGTIGAGRLIVLAREAEVGERFAGTWAQLAKLSDMRYVTMLKMTIGTDIINFGLFTEDTLNKLSEIDKKAGLDDAARTRAKIFLLSQLLFAGGMTFLSLRGNVGGLERNPTLVLHPGPDGVPMVSDARLWLPENLHAEDLLDKIRSVAEQRKFPLTTKDDALNNVESLLKGVQTESFGQSKNAVPVLETLLGNSSDFEKTARAVSYCQRNGFTHFDVVYEGILNIPDDKLNAVKTALNTHLAENPGFKLQLTDDEIKAIIQKGKTLNLSEQDVNDFLLISSREKKPIVATELMTQMDNWKIVQQRGFPFLFNDMKTFGDFKLEIKKLLVKYGVPVNDIKVQGSSLRTPSAKDIDMAVFVSDSVFDEMVAKIRAGIISRTGSNPKLRKNLLQQLNNGVEEGRINSFLFDRIPTSSQSFNQEMYDLNKFLSAADKGFDLSVMKSSGKFVLNPSLDF